MTLVVALSYSLALTWFEADALHTKQLNAFAQHSQRAANMLALPLWNLDNEFLDMYFALLTDTPDILCAELRGEGISTRMHPPGCSTNPAGITFERDIQHGIDGNQQIIGQLRLSFALKDNLYYVKPHPPSVIGTFGSFYFFIFQYPQTFFPPHFANSASY
jgi:hypothetical protein